jgi:methionyl aminopeptidase
MSIIIKSNREIDKMRRAGRLTAEVLAVLARSVHPKMKTSELDEIAARESRARNAIPSFNGYQGYPANLCVSINDEIVHGIPGERVIEEGDIVSLDFGIIYDGYQGDTAVTVGVGKIGEKARELMKVTEESLKQGIAAARCGAYLGDVSAAIQKYVESHGFSVVREYTGHGIGRHMHEEPQIPNFGNPGEGPVLKKGMVLAIEPMVNVGGWHARVAEDNWLVLTEDGSLSAHFEHTVAITDNGAEILTVV